MFTFLRGFLEEFSIRLPMSTKECHFRRSWARDDEECLHHPAKWSTNVVCYCLFHSYLTVVTFLLLRQVNTLVGSPMRLQQIVNQMLRSGTRFPSVKKITMGGATMTQTLVDGTLSAFRGLRCLRSLYAMAESCGIVCCPAVDDIGNTTLGFPTPMTEIKVYLPQASPMIRARK